MTTFYIKYRPKSLEELDLEGVRKSLKKLIEQDAVPHALLFSGPKGTGKTSAARILAKIVNCEKNEKELKEPCNRCSQCISISKGINVDVVELDAASHRGIDDIRSLREAVKLSSATARKKVYIIDEAHMLTTEASNALLKTLEEPPTHVVFILATTNPEKLIGTIRSRTTNIMFNKASALEIKRSLERVAKGEKLEVEEDAYLSIARKAEGSLRDAVKMLEQLVEKGNQKITNKLFLETFIDQDAGGTDQFLQLLEERQAVACLKMIDSLSGQGASIPGFVKNILARLQADMLYHVGTQKTESKPVFELGDTVLLIKQLINVLKEMEYSFIEELPLEIMVVEWCSLNKTDKSNIPGENNNHNNLRIESLNSNKHGNSDHSSRQKKTEELKMITQPNGQDSAKASEKKIVAVPPPAVVKNINLELTEGFTEKIWIQVLSQIKPRNASTEALLRATKPINFDGEVLTLGVFYKFHKEHLESNQHRHLLEDVISQMTGNAVKVVCTLTEPTVWNNTETTSTTSTDEVIETKTILTEGEDKDIINMAKKIFEN